MAADSSELHFYEIDPGDADIPIGCVIKTQPIGFFSQDHVIVERCDQLDGNPLIGWSEELLGNIVALKFRNGVAMEPQRPIQILLPYLHTRNSPSKMAVIKVQNEGSTDWTEKECIEVDSTEVFKGSYKFLQTTITTPTDCKMAVVSRLKKETLTASVPDALRVTSSIDPKVIFTFKQVLLKKSLTFELEYLHVDFMTVQEVKRRNAKVAKRLLGCSGIVTLRDLNMYISITLPIHPPPSANRIKRPSTGMNNYPTQPIVKGVDSKNRPKTANLSASFFSLINSSKEDVIEDRLSLMVFQEDGTKKEGAWYVSRMVNFSETRRKDLVTIDLERPIPTKFIVLRYKNEGGNRGYRYAGDYDGDDDDDDDDEMVLREMVETIERMLMVKSVHFLLRQHEEDPRKVIVQIVAPLKLDRTLKKLTNDGYSRGPPVSPPTLLREGQEVELKFRTNIGGIKADDKAATFTGGKEAFEEEDGGDSVSDKIQLPVGCTNSQIFDLRTSRHLANKQTPKRHEPRTIRMVFNSYLHSQVNLDLYVVDKYSQRALDCYRGFVQIFAKIDPSTCGNSEVSEIVYGESQTNGLPSTYPLKILEDNLQENLVEGGDDIIRKDDGQDTETSTSDQFDGPPPPTNHVAIKRFAYMENRIFYANMKLLCELLVDLPKTVDDRPKFSIKRPPFIIRPDGIVDHSLLENLAKQIGKEWIHMAEQLNVKLIRIDSIFKDSCNEKAALDVFMSWIKRMPRCSNKVEILSKAFQACGRKDLSRFLIKKNEEFRRRQPIFDKEAVLARSIKTLGRYSYLVYDWRLLCQRFGLSDDFIDSIQSKCYDARERCHKILTKWQENGTDAGLDVLTCLIKILRDSNCHQLAEILQKEYGN